MSDTSRDQGFAQPTLGLAALALILGVSFAVMAAFRVDVFNSWVAFLAMTIIPTQIICGLVWHCGQPAALAKLPQPAKGIAYLAFCAMVGAVVAIASLQIVGGGITPPTPPLVMFVIFSIVVTFWFVVVWGTWPISALPLGPVASGLVGVAFCYVLAYALFELLFDFAFLKGAPFYANAIDPHGAFNAWQPLVFGVTSVAAITFSAMFEFWPLPKFGLKPGGASWGLAASLYVLTIAAIVFSGFVMLAGMDIVQYMVAVPVPFIFGFFIVMSLLHKFPFAHLTQPRAGLALSVTAALVGYGMFMLYDAASSLVTGQLLPSGAPTYDLELWLASAMLAVTFPLIVVFADFLGFWPLRSTASSGAETTAGEVG